MTYIRPLQNQNTPLGQTPFDSLKAAGQGVFNAGVQLGAGALSPYANAAAKTGLLGVFNTPLRIEKLGDPYQGHVPDSEAASISIYGVALDAAAVMTHCMVRDDVDYRSIPTSALDPKSLSASLRYQVSSSNLKKGDPYPVTPKIAPYGRLVADAKGQRIAKNVEEVIRPLSDFEETEEAQQAHALMKSDLRASDLVGKQIDEVSTLTVKDPQVEALLKSAAYKAGAKNLSSSLNKVYVGDHVPKTLELRFILHDALVQDGSSLRLDRSRFDLLSWVHTSFCSNPSGVSRFKSEKTLRSVAAEINATNVRGRLVELSSKGIDPYGVTTWLTTSFEHREVPDNDLIAVRVTLREFESLYTAPDPSSVSATDASAGPVAVAPAAPVRPSYTGAA